jgi:hypothetical protein
MKQHRFSILIILGLGLLTGATSCKKDLQDVIPQDQISTSLTLSDPNAAQTLYSGVYASLRGYNSTLFALGEMRSEIWTDGLFTESVDGGLSQYYTHNISALNVPANNWGGFYNLLYQVNNVINLYPQVSVLSSAVKNQALAEMYGLRAYIYYTMLRTWGDVPLNTTPISTINNAAQTYKARTKVDSIMLQIKNDINQSLTLFNGNNALPAGKRVYWNRLATLSLKGDVYLWSGTLMGGGTNDLNTALAALQEIEGLQSATLSLDANYADIFDPTKKANNPEIIFALNYELNQAQMGTFGSFQVNSIQATTLSFQQVPNAPTVSSIYPYVNGANRCGMNQNMINKLTSGPADQRINGSFKVMYSTSAPYATRGVLLTKWIGSTSGTTQVYNNDYPIYRYAEILLMAAEAKAKLGQDPSAEINQIRQRAYGATYIPYVNSTIDDNIQAVLEEQLREFIGEGKRWFGLRRAGDKWVFKYVDPKYLSPATVNSGKGPTFLLPISMSMLNNDPLLTQTTGY